MSETAATIDQHPNDRPAHRVHLIQMTMQQIASTIDTLRTRRASIQAKVEKAKSNSKIADALQTEKKIAKLITKLEKKLANISIDIDDAADDLNKMRALFLQLSDGELLLEKEPTNNGNAQVERN